ncbi:hypothetical protein SXCC_00594 [Gluconacetobacter sp. SXCC-1]|nr:hypothetical protein SXCC_00594 [Gluconacetobacter sp. SXCC-1]
MFLVTVVHLLFFSRSFRDDSLDKANDRYALSAHPSVGQMITCLHEA